MELWEIIFLIIIFISGILLIKEAIKEKKINDKIFAAMANSILDKPNNESDIIIDGNSINKGKGVHKMIKHAKENGLDFYVKHDGLISKYEDGRKVSTEQFSNWLEGQKNEK